MYKFVRPYKKPVNNNNTESTAKSKQTTSNSSSNSQATTKKRKNENEIKEKENIPVANLEAASNQFERNVNEDNSDKVNKELRQTSHENISIIEKNKSVERKPSFVTVKRNKSLDTKSGSSRIEIYNDERFKKSNVFSVIYDSINTGDLFICYENEFIAKMKLKI